MKWWNYIFSQFLILFEFNLPKPLQPVILSIITLMLWKLSSRTRNFNIPLKKALKPGQMWNEH